MMMGTKDEMFQVLTRDGARVIDVKSNKNSDKRQTMCAKMNNTQKKRKKNRIITDPENMLSFV